MSLIVTFEDGELRSIRYCRDGVYTMPLPADFNPEKHCPCAVACARCRTIYCKPTTAYKLLATGIVEQLFICQGCLWGAVVRYDPTLPNTWIHVQLISPGKGRGWVKPIPKLPKKSRKIPPPSW